MAVLRRASIGHSLARCLTAAALAGALLAGGGTGLAAPPGATAGPIGRDLPSWVDVPDQVYFPETGHHLAEPFLFYWRANGGRTVFGLPISEVIPSADDRLRAQYFERATLVYRPNTGGAAALVVGQGATTISPLNLRAGPGTAYGKVGLLGREQRVQLIGGPLPDADGEPWYQVAGAAGSGWSKGEFLERHDDPIGITTVAVDPAFPRFAEAPFRPLPPIVRGALGPETDDAVVFPSTGHSLSGPFKRFWEGHGGAAILGLPLSEPFEEASPEDGRTRLVQYFERAKMERHAEAPDGRDEVQLAALGRRLAAATGVAIAPADRAAGTPDYDEGLFRGPKWIEVNLGEQRLTAWDGDMPELTTLIRSGKQGWETPPGTYRIYRKLPHDDMTLGTPGDPDYYYIEDVPWVMYFLDGGYAIHAADWLDVWGAPTSRGCVNTPGEIASALYAWAPLGTLVWIHH